MSEDFNTNNEFSGKDNQNKKPKFGIGWMYVLIFGFIFLIYFLNSGTRTLRTTWKDFINNMLLTKDVEKVVIVNNKIVEVYIKQDKLNLPKYKEISQRGFSGLNATGPHYRFEIPSVDYFLKKLEEAQVSFPDSERIYPESITRRDFGDVFGWLLPILIFVIIWIIIFRKMSSVGGGAGGPSNIFNVGKSRAKVFDKDTRVNVNFNDVAGLDEAKLEVREIVDFLKNPQKYAELGGKIPKGVLLVGPPGTGKTLLAKAVAGEANVPFFSLSGSDFVEMFVGVGASRVRDLFKQAKEKAPCIIFIDEIDAIGRARGRNPSFSGNDERENTLNQLLTEMDGFESNTGVIILAATNRADILDKALLRAGRFDRQIQLELPDLNERKEIFKVHMRTLKYDSSIDIDFLARQTPGFSGADIANVCNEAALIAARKNKKIIEKQDFLDAIDRIVGGLEKKNKLITKEEKQIIAFHEAGHATVGWLLKYGNPLVKVTIVPRGKSLGAAWYLPEERNIINKEQMLDEICTGLAGRAAEEVVFGTMSTGAINDLERVTKQAYAMVAYYGLSERLGNISFYDSTGQNEFAFVKPYSEKTAELIDNETKRIVEEQYQRAFSIITNNKDKVIQLGSLLLEKEVIFTEDVEKILGPRPYAKEKSEEQLETINLKDRENNENFNDSNKVLS